MNPKPLRTWVTGAFVIFGGIATLNVASTLTIKALQFASDKKRVMIYQCALLFPILLEN